jgi:hypothetical protein
MDFTTLPIALALALGVLSLPVLPIYNYNRRGIGIVRYHFGVIGNALSRVSLSSLVTWRTALALALIVGALLVAPDSAHGAPMLMGAVLPGMGSGLEKQLAAYLGRNQGPEFFTSTPHNGTAQTVLIPRNLNINRPLERLLFRWRGRVVIAGANYTVAAAESPQTIIQRITVNGTFKGTALTPIKISGATAYVWPRMFGLRGSSSYFTVGGVTTRQAEPTVPFQQTLANFGNTGTYDLDIWYDVPVWPIVEVGSRADEIVPYLWQPQDWADSLQVTLDLGDLSSFGTPAAMTTATFTAFGSAAGSPTVEIYTQYAILGTFRPGVAFRTACVVRNEQTITAGMTGIASNVRIMPLQKQKTTNIMVKSGAILAGTSAGVQVFGTLTDAMLDKTLIVVDNKFIRNNLSNLASKENIGYSFQAIEPQGYLPFSFIDSQTPRTAFRADDPNVVGSGSNFELDTDVLTAGAQQAVNVVQEMIFADRDDPSWAGTR